MSERDDEPTHGSDHEELVAVLNRLYARDDAIASMTHRELVALLNRVYVRIGEAPVTKSAARASTSDELRAAIRAVRRRHSAKSEPVTLPAIEPAQRELPTSRREGPRMFCVIVTPDPALVSQVRTVLRAHGIPAVAVGSADDLATLARQAMPTHVVVDGRHATAVTVGGALRELSREVTILQGSDADAVLAAVSAISTAGPRDPSRSR